ncbi:hypothetical protein [Vibrio fluvialis]|uniref:hypothetical protein n=1 Tax=Vibrio fluvialis TaxID=676 RepID=UPI001EEA6644|nr:hypothetical protein [Vibrio fluvialis]MCG6365028.1 hypothetical protein [Vibrio fluvialis]
MRKRTKSDNQSLLELEDKGLEVEMNKLWAKTTFTIGFLWMISNNAVAINACNSTFEDHREMILCIQNETASVESKVKKAVTESDEYYGFYKDFYNKQRLAIHEKCVLYIKLGGQRGELLMTQCELDGVISLELFVKKYIDDLDNT